jgi:hypothetical protein
VTPLTFSVANATELIPDARLREITAEAREYADAGRPPRDVWPAHGNTTYWSGVLLEHERLVWLDTYERRVARIRRMGARL